MLSDSAILVVDKQQCFLGAGFCSQQKRDSLSVFIIVLFLNLDHSSQTGLKHVTKNLELVLFLFLPTATLHSAYVGLVDASQAFHHLSHICY